MPRTKTFQKIYERFIKEYGAKEGKRIYYAWVNARGYNDKRSFRHEIERTEKLETRLER